MHSISRGQSNGTSKYHLKVISRLIQGHLKVILQPFSTNALVVKLQSLKAHTYNEFVRWIILYGHIWYQWKGTDLRRTNMSNVKFARWAVVMETAYEFQIMS